MTKSKPIIDIHTHVYLPGMMDILRSRSTVPFVRDGRLVILPSEEGEESSTKRGRPIGDEYYSIERKLEFMDLHGFDKSIISSPNPWLDFLDGKEQVDAACMLNDELTKMCDESGGRIAGFGLLPLSEIEASVEEVKRISSIGKLKGFIIGTKAGDRTLDHPDLIPLWKALAESGLVSFVHPHYGVGDDYGDSSGHVLPLALGFPFETTTAIARLILSGVFDLFPDLKLLLAHSGGTLPFLAGRLDSCVAHDPACADRLQFSPSTYLKNLYYDAVCYSPSTLKCLLSFTSVENVMFGTDNPFFPPLKGKIHEKEWKSVIDNLAAIKKVCGEGSDEARLILSGNAERIFKL